MMGISTVYVLVFQCGHMYYIRCPTPAYIGTLVIVFHCSHTLWCLYFQMAVFVIILQYCRISPILWSYFFNVVLQPFVIVFHYCHVAAFCGCISVLVCTSFPVILKVSFSSSVELISQTLWCYSLHCLIVKGWIYESSLCLNIHRWIVYSFIVVIIQRMPFYNFLLS